jgi:hypothetical protein
VPGVARARERLFVLAEWCEPLARVRTRRVRRAGLGKDERAYEAKREEQSGPRNDGDAEAYGQAVLIDLGVVHVVVPVALY